MTLPTTNEAAAQIARLAEDAIAHNGVVTTEVELAPGEANYWTLNRAARDLRRADVRVTTMRNPREKKIILTARPSR